MLHSKGKSEWSDLFGWVSETVCCSECMRAKWESERKIQTQNTTSSSGNNNIRARPEKTSLPVFLLFFVFIHFLSFLHRICCNHFVWGFFDVCCLAMYTWSFVLVRPVLWRSLHWDLPVWCAIVSVLVYNMSPTSTETKILHWFVVCKIFICFIDQSNQPTEWY